MKTYKQFTESMLPEPSMARKQVINPMPPKEPVEVKKEPAEVKVKKEYDDKFNRHDKEIKGLKDKFKKLSVSEESDGRVDRAYAIDGHGNKYRDYNNDGVSDRQRRMKAFAAKRLRIMLRGV